MRKFTSFEEENLKYLTQCSIESTLVQITETGYKKSILDATEPMRHYFKKVGMHDYDIQEQGPSHKKIQESIILEDNNAIPSKTSLYRPETKKGDPRIWPSKITKYCSPNDILMMIFHNECLYIINISRVNIRRICSEYSVSPLASLVYDLKVKEASVSKELEDKLRDISLDWHPCDVLADTGVGRAIETLLGIDMNCSKDPDYKGIELKSFRDKRPGIRSTLFCQVPNWEKSYLKSAKAIVQKYGYVKDGGLTYQNTLKCNVANSQNLGMSLYQSQLILAIEEMKAIKNSVEQISGYSKVADVALWDLDLLHERLLTKHKETFWINVEQKIINGTEFFRPTFIEHTKNPVVSHFDSLLDAGYITVDLLLSRPSGHGDTIAFKIKPKSRPLLFPENEIIQLL